MLAPLVASVCLLAACEQMVAKPAPLFEVETPEGRRVVLKSDRTWEYVQADTDEGKRLVLSVQGKREASDGCIFRIGLRNEMGTLVRSIVPQLSAVTSNGVRLDTRFKEFSDLKPTLEQQRDVQFLGIGCGKIAYLKVDGADQCLVGEFSAQRENCLRWLQVAPGGVTRIIKGEGQ